MEMVMLNEIEKNENYTKKHCNNGFFLIKSMMIHIIYSNENKSTYFIAIKIILYKNGKKIKTFPFQKKFLLLS